MSKIIIIPGSCSSKDNWFDQVADFEALGFEVIYIELGAYKFTTMTEMTSHIFSQLVEHCSQGPVKIMAHSMGAMSLLKILLDRDYYSKQNAEIYKNIQQSRLVFVQIPLSVNQVTLNLLYIGRLICIPILLLHRWLITWWLNALLIFLKKSFLKLPQVMVGPVRLVTNLLLMHSSCWGVRAKEYWNLVYFYSQWENYLYEQLNLEDTEVEQILNKSSAKSQSVFEPECTKNYFFTTGGPDQFCYDYLTRALVKKIAANEVNLKWGFHCPQHMPWHQDRLAELLL